MNHISVLNPNELDDFAPMLEGALEEGMDGTPILLGYKKDDKALGALAAVQIEDVVILRWLVVEEEVQRQKIASRLLKVLYQYAAAKKISEISVVVCLSGREKEVAEMLLLKNGFQMIEQNKTFSLPLSVITESSLASHIKKARHSNVAALSEISNLQLQEFNLEIMKEGELLQIESLEILTECSYVWLENGKITGCILLTAYDEDIEIQWLYGKNPLAVQEMIMAAASSLMDKYSVETRIYATALQPSVESLIRKLAGDKLTEEQTVDLYQCLL